MLNSVCEYMYLLSYTNVNVYKQEYINWVCACVSINKRYLCVLGTYLQLQI